MAGKYDVVHNERKFWLNTRRVVAYVFLSIMCIVCLFFFYIMLVNCTRSHEAIQSKGFVMAPSGFFIENFKAIMNDDNNPLIYGLRNSLIVSVGTVICSIYFSAMTAYGVHVYDFKGRKFAFNFILMIMTIPTQVTALGFFDMMVSWDLLDSFIPLIIPAVAAPTVFFFMKQYMDSSLPLDIVEAARID
ncbi:MAG: carbohydrate ABC transporter permease, partial [Ruminococcaceae bacterium]|nr:carbohydrate ABC transporter permease [Oscillospiraceae bacterium]